LDERGFFKGVVRRRAAVYLEGGLGRKGVLQRCGEEEGSRVVIPY